MGNVSANHDCRYLQGQRWGSAFPAPALAGQRGAMGESGSTVRLMEVGYESQTPPLVYRRPDAGVGGGGLGDKSDADIDYLADGGLRLYYAGDFCSKRPPGFEAAALSGLDVAEHILANLRSDPSM